MKILNWYKEKNIEDILFYTSWGLLILAVLLTTTAWWLIDLTTPAHLFPDITRLIKYLATFLTCIVILFNLIQKKYNVKALIGYGVLLAIFLISAYFSKNTEYVGYWFFFASAYKKDTKKILEISIVLMGLLLLIVVICSQIGLAMDMLFEENPARHTLGFNYCTTAPILYFFFVIEYILLRKEKIRIGELLILEVVNVFFFLMNHTHMAFYLGTAMILFFAVQSLLKNHWKILSKLKWIWIILPAIIFIGAIGIHWFFKADSQFLASINQIIHGRLGLGKTAIDTYGVSLFGQPITWMGSSVIQPENIWELYNYVDCSYLQIMLEFGVVTICAIVGLYIIGIFRGTKIKNYWVVFAMLFAMVLCITEPRLMIFVYNILPIMAVTNLEYEGFVFAKKKDDK